MARGRISAVLTRRANLRYAFPPDFAQRLNGQPVRRVGRRAKYLVVELGSGDVLLMHLGMSGSFRVVHRNTLEKMPHQERYGPHDHVVFEMSTGAVVIFNDPRRFGFMALVAPD